MNEMTDTYCSSLRVAEQDALGGADFVNQVDVGSDDSIIRSGPASNSLLVVLIPGLNGEDRTREGSLGLSTGVSSNSECLPSILLVSKERILGVDLRVLGPS